MVDRSPQISTLGEFRVAGVLGEGGSGVVYDATWGPRRVALKVLHASLLGTGSARAQFLTEAQRLQQITHPSVVKVLAVGELPDGRPYLAMERLDGETLASVVARGPLALGHALELFGELCAAVAALHDQGLVHRDLKPENVFVVSAQHAVLLDFGIAKDLAAPASTTTQEGNVRGTPAYMAPERFFGQTASIATDIYELAVTLYTMLAGRLPWDHVADPESRLSPRPLTEVAPSVPEVLDIEIRRALSTRAQNRPASALALLEAVRAAAADHVGDAEPGPSSTARLRPAGPTGPGNDHPTPLAWAPTQPAVVTAARPRGRRTAIVMGAVAGVLALGGAALWQLRDRATRTPHVTTTEAVTTGSSAAPDPWGTAPARPEPTTTSTSHFALVADVRPAEVYRAEAAAAVTKLPADTHVVMTVQLAELRANPHTAKLLESLGQQPKIASVALLLPLCVRGLFTDAEWIVFGAPSLEAARAGTLVVRGRWRRSEIEACFPEKRYVARDGATLLWAGDIGWLDFLDNQTVVLTLASKIEPEDAHRSLTHGKGPGARVRELLARLPTARSLAVAADGTARDDLSALSLPRGSDLFGLVTVGTDAVTLDLAADTKATEAAQAVVDKVKPELDGVFGKASSSATGRIDVRRDGTVVRVDGRLTSLMLGIVTSTL